MIRSRIFTGIFTGIFTSLGTVICTALVILTASALTPAIAQDITCNPDGAQAEMNVCAFEDFERADAALNAEYKLAVDAAKGMGVYDQLRAAQRAWLPFRDAACAAEAAPFQGGTLQPLILYSCLATLTEERTRHLTSFSQM